MLRLISHIIIVLAWSASAALAECGWVLWEEREEIVMPKAEPIRESSLWKLHDAYKEHVECEKAKRSAWENMTEILTKADDIKAGILVTKKDGTWVSLERKRQDGGSESVSSSYYRCLPGTFDPRERK